MINPIDELRIYRFDAPKEDLHDHAADALRYAFMSNAIYEIRRRRTPWLKIIIIVLAIAALIWLATM